MTIRVEPVGEAGLGVLEPLWKSLTDHHRSLVGDRLPVHDGETSWAVRREQYRTWLHDGVALLFAAYRGERAVGYLCCRLLPSGATFDFGERRGEVDSLVVEPGERAGGVGTALLEHCRAELKRRDVEYWSIGVLAANTGAAELYRRLGFEPWLQDLIGRT